MSRSLASKIEAANSALMANRRVDAIGEFFTLDNVTYLTNQDMNGGDAAIRKVLGMYRRAFPDLHVDVEILVEVKDRVAWQRTLRGTHKGGSKASLPPAIQSCGAPG